jgi:hypothetical protein
MAKSTVASFAFFFAIVLPGCSKDDSTTGPASPATITPPPSTYVSHLPDQLRGYWMVQSVTVDGVETPLAEALHRNQSTDAEILGLVGENEYYLSDYDADAASLYYESGATAATSQQLVLMTLKVNGQTISPYNTLLSSWKVQGDTLALSIEIDGKAVVANYMKFDLYSSRYF